MKLLILLAVLTLTQSRYTEDKCSGIIAHNIKHEKEVLKSGLTSPYQLAMDYDTNTVFFSYSSEGENVFESAFINLKTNEFSNIPGISGGFANAVDSKKNIVYLGGRDGIYKYNYASKKAEHLHTTNDNIWQLFYKDTLYYSRYPDENAFVFRNDKFEKVPELQNTRAFLIGLDNYGNIYFSNSSGLFYYKKSNGLIDYIGDFNVNGFTSDLNGNLYFSTPDGIFYINVNKKEVERIAEIDSIYGLAIEGDGNILYASYDSIIRLKATKIFCPVEEYKISFAA
ncbi:ommochrome-binding protein-like [Colias croceus]|uniref:ommochrome-binding protein-like n=1 Tax=Colias crocea TaxID=72248 RepID=UPI001E27EC79|nr:ommochrome-binding protein-like [Colias croceus]XP_045494335.1 ommochrome-binding protein-like [Colias croceus]